MLIVNAMLDGCKNQIKELVDELWMGKNGKYVSAIYRIIYLIFKKIVFILHIAFKTLSAFNEVL